MNKDKDEQEANEVVDRSIDYDQNVIDQLIEEAKPNIITR